MGIQINGNTNNINAGIGSLSIEDLNELDIVGVATASNFKTGSSNLHSTGLTVGNALVHSTGINVGTGATVHSPSSNVLTLGTNSIERVRITSGGNVGIGTITPLAGLHISDGTAYGAPQITNRKAQLIISAGSETSSDIQLLANSYNHIFFGTSSDANAGGIFYHHTGSYTNSFQIENGGCQTFFRPSGTFDIKSASAQGNSFVQNFMVRDSGNNAQYQIGMYDTNTQNLYINNHKGNVRIAHGGINNVHFAATGGHVGIGSNFSPSRKLDVKDSTGANRIMNIRGTGTSGAFLAFLDANTTDDSKCRVGSIGGNSIGMRGDAHHFQNGAGTDRMIITSTGQFVVGSNPTVNSGNIVHIEAPTSFNSGETIVNIEGNNAAAAARILLHNNNTGGSAYNEILGVDAGGQSTSSIRFYNTDQSNNYGEIAFGTRNQSGVPPVDRMRISKEGYVNKPYHPAFCATRSGASNIQLHQNSNIDVDFPTKDFDNSNSFNTSNGRFTAPIAGKYYFGVQFYCGFSVTSVRVMHASWRKNGSLSHEADLFGGIGNFGNSSMNHYHPTTNAHVMLELAAGDYVTFNTGTNSFIGSGNTYLYGSKGSRFFGYLVA